MSGVEVVITGAEIRVGDRAAATVALVEVGGGTQTVTVDGVAEERTHPASRLFHVRLISPDRMLPDELREADDYEAAVKLGKAYASKLAKHAEQIEKLADDLKV